MHHLCNWPLHSFDHCATSGWCWCRVNMDWFGACSLMDAFWRAFIWDTPIFTLWAHFHMLFNDSTQDLLVCSSSPFPERLPGSWLITGHFPENCIASHFRPFLSQKWMARCIDYNCPLQRFSLFTVSQCKYYPFLAYIDLPGWPTCKQSVDFFFLFQLGLIGLSIWR